MKRAILTVSFVILGAVILLLGGQLLGPYALSVLTTALFYVGLAAAWNIIGGIGGQFSLGHSLFVVAGSSIPAALVSLHHWPEGVAVLTGVIIAVVCAIILGWLLFRRAVPVLAFALITLAFAEIGKVFITSTEWLGAASGVVWKTRFGLSSAEAFLMVSALSAAAVILVNHFILSSKFGFALRAIRDQEEAATALGIRSALVKTIAFAISAGATAIISTFYSMYIVFVDPEMFASPVMSIAIILYVVVGGSGTVWGPLLGVAVLIPLEEVARASVGEIAGLSDILLGIGILLVILTNRGGLVALWQRVRIRLSAG